MNTYKFEVTEAYTPNPLNGTIVAPSKEDAIHELKEWYACELGTIEDEINVKIIAEIVN